MTFAVGYAIINTERNERRIKMKTFTLTHKHCGMEIKVEGYDFWDACKKNGLDIKVWKAN